MRKETPTFQEPRFRSRKLEPLPGAWCKAHGVDAKAPPTLSVQLVFAERDKMHAETAKPSTNIDSSLPFDAGTHDWQYRGYPGQDGGTGSGLVRRRHGS